MKLILLLALVSLACAAPVLTPTPRSVDKAVHIYTTSTLTPKSVVTAGLLNIRSEPTEHSRVVGNLHSGDRIVVYDCVDDVLDGGKWARIGDGQWVNARYLEGVCD